MSGLNLNFKCHATCNADCHGCVNVPRRERCRDCDIYTDGDFDKGSII
jgi:hypothetical protein